jgi:thioredoxin reductase
MASIVVVGDGPGGLSAALFLAKNGHRVTVFGQDNTAIHYALLKNFLGFDEIPGSEFQEKALSQVRRFGAVIRYERVASVSAEPLSITTEGGERVAADYLILTEGKNPVLARSLGLDQDDAGAILVDRDNRSSVERVYVVGRSARPTRSQAIISAGDGAKAALDIIAREVGKDVQDWDSPPR